VPRRPLSRRFFDRPTTVVAQALLGQELTVRARRRERSVRIVETEAYVATDPASHAFRGRTARNGSMFGPPGTLYVYRIHQVVCANITTRSGEAVLLRAGEPLQRSLPNTSGPGRLCRALGITIRDDGSQVGRGRIRVVRGRRPPGPIVVGPRVGIRRAADRRLRFALNGNRWVSRPRPIGWRESRAAGVTSASPSDSFASEGSRRTRRRHRRLAGGGRNGSRTDGK
jgi:DNA-3-methyladenine glycosylase